MEQGRLIGGRDWLLDDLPYRVILCSGEGIEAGREGFNLELAFGSAGLGRLGSPAN